MDSLDDATLLHILEFVNFDNRGNRVIRTCKRFKRLYSVIVPNLEPDQLLLLGCENGNSIYVSSAIARGANEWNEGLRSACFGGHLALANLMIEKGAASTEEYSRLRTHQ